MHPGGSSRRPRLPATTFHQALRRSVLLSPWHIDHRMWWNSLIRTVCIHTPSRCPRIAALTEESTTSEPSRVGGKASRAPQVSPPKPSSGMTARAMWSAQMPRNDVPQCHAPGWYDIKVPVEEMQQQFSIPTRAGGRCVESWSRSGRRAAGSTPNDRAAAATRNSILPHLSSY